MANREPGRPLPPSRWGRLSKNLALWILILVVPVFLFQLMSRGSRQVQELTFTDFVRQVESGNVLRVTIIDGRRVDGELKTELPSARPGGPPVNRFRTLLPARDDPTVIKFLQDNGVVIAAGEARTPWLAYLANVLPYVLIIALWILFMRQMQAGGARAFSFGKSKAKLLSGETPKLTFADVAGCDEAKEELQEIIEFLKDPSKFVRLGGRLPKGALLVGPPGTGKTLLAKAVAGEAARPFFSMSGSDFVEMFVGVGAARVRDLFEQGKAHAPCIIFIDEIDAVGRHRGAGLGGGHDEREQTLNQLLVEMDGFESNEGVILLAATNRPDVLDPALLRPGRFDRQIVVDPPDVKGREGILRVHARSIPLADDVDVALLAKATPGMSGADLANMVNEAALLAARKNKDKVYMEDFEEARDKVVLGAERKSMVISEEERRLTAYHEAGHALAALLTPDCDPLHKVTIVPRGRALGVTWSVPIDDRHTYSKAYLEAQLISLYGGRVAEEIVFGPEKITTGAGNDIERATELARRMVTQFGMSEIVGPMTVGDQEEQVFLGRELAQRRTISERTAQLVDTEVRKFLDAAYQRAKGLIQADLPLLHALAEELLERETLDAEEIHAVVEGRPLPPLGRSLPPGDGSGRLSGAGADEPKAAEAPLAREAGAP